MAEDKEKTKPEPKKMSDVAKPGDTPADATSRPVIVKHRSLMKDPMVASPNPSQLEADESPEKEVESKESGSEKKDTSDAMVNRKAAKIEPPTSSDDKPKDAETTSESEKDPKDKGNSDNKSESLGTAAVDTMANEAVKKSKNNKEDKEKVELIQKHIEEKTYFAPIGQISKRKAKTRFIILIVFILLLIACYFAIDAGLILENVVLPLDLIK